MRFLKNCPTVEAPRGPDLPEVGVVARVLVEDTVEVESGQPLLLIRASD